MLSLWAKDLLLFLLRIILNPNTYSYGRNAGIIPGLNNKTVSKGRENSPRVNKIVSKGRDNFPINNKTVSKGRGNFPINY